MQLQNAQAVVELSANGNRRQQGGWLAGQEPQLIQAPKTPAEVIAGVGGSTCLSGRDDLLPTSPRLPQPQVTYQKSMVTLLQLPVLASLRFGERTGSGRKGGARDPALKLGATTTPKLDTDINGGLRSVDLAFNQMPCVFMWRTHVLSSSLSY